MDQIRESAAVADSPEMVVSESGKRIRLEDFSLMDKQLAVDMMREEMLEAAENLNFERAAKLRDEIGKLEQELQNIF